MKKLVIILLFITSITVIRLKSYADTEIKEEVIIDKDKDNLADIKEIEKLIKIESLKQTPIKEELEEDKNDFSLISSEIEDTGEEFDINKWLEKEDLNEPGGFYKD